MPFFFAKASVKLFQHLNILNLYYPLKLKSHCGQALFVSIFWLPNPERTLATFSPCDLDQFKNPDASDQCHLQRLS